MSKAKFHVELVSKGIRELLRSDEIQANINEAARQVASRAGKGYSVIPGTKGKTRANVRVQADSKEAKRDNMDNNTLLKALGR